MDIADAACFTEAALRAKNSPVLGTLNEEWELPFGCTNSTRQDNKNAAPKTTAFQDFATNAMPIQYSLQSRREFYMGPLRMKRRWLFYSGRSRIFTEATSRLLATGTSNTNSPPNEGKTTALPVQRKDKSPYLVNSSCDRKSTQVTPETEGNTVEGYFASNTAFLDAQLTGGFAEKRIFSEITTPARSTGAQTPSPAAIASLEIGEASKSPCTAGPVSVSLCLFSPQAVIRRVGAKTNAILFFITPPIVLISVIGALQKNLKAHCEAIAERIARR
jgi:hypothetical protein